MDLENKTRKWSSIGSFVAGLFVGVLVTLLLNDGWGPFSKPLLDSDVPVTSDIGWWAYDECLTVSEFRAEATEEVTHGMLNAEEKFVIEYRIVGQLESDPPFRPYVKSVFVSDRFAISSTGLRYVDVLVRPQIDIHEDESYGGKSIPFDVGVQRAYNTFQWGQNEYRADCHGRTSTVIVHQGK